ncbi:MAG: hypothetical protein COV74_09560 [Candidatus Omnitrophica bacterium CG11_big_fil_rev_8_21_14_0_20_45_26]|uniref:SGNH hydrolase-type esterase domain-containing protein n=1 Tax=Candidatus Abzuiibacterium crystallinum TaxID=1974748 RepID=A0A2H0LNX8_9BACT|nr:MAG: hypothetical protein COV74_09560 [Candidatus Omnitrophica bacterium CG11_big_fil_rev_8_21_14_0_20_45_26]PIW65391.1 MAG: hypothetical protein COW12_02130 [Candidatus Omnitrophica bacterium CG12_big_fil_rev_8_21_14_0_65_45_16]
MIKNFFINVILLVVSVLFCLLLFEVYLRWQNIGWINVPSVHFDAKSEYFNRPNFQSIFLYQGRKTHQTINQFGFRNPPIEMKKKEEVSRIAFVGDSFTFGFNVNDGDEYPALVINNVAPDGSIDYLNAGVENIGLSHELAIYRNYVKSFQPDVVILTFCTNNDFEDIYLGPYKRKGNQLVYESPKKWPIYYVQDWLYSNPVTLNVVRHSYAVSYFRDILGRRINAKRKQFLSERMPSDDREVVDDTMFFIDQLAREAASSQAAFLIVIAPGKLFYHDTFLRGRLKLLTDQLKQRGYAFFDLRPYFQAELQKGLKNYETLWGQPDQHWSEKGNRLAAENVSQFLRKVFA